MVDGVKVPFEVDASQANEAIENFRAAGVKAFDDILNAAKSGDISGIVGMMFGRVAQEVTKAGQAFADFLVKQAEVVEKFDAVREAFGATSDEARGLSEVFGEAGVSAEGFERLMSRMGTTIERDMARVEERIRDSATEMASAVEAAEEASIRAEKSRTPGGKGDAGTQMQEEALQQQRAATAEIRAQNELYDKQLKNLPMIIDAVKGIGSGIDLSKVAAEDLYEAFQKIGKFNGKDTLLAIADAVQKGTINAEELRGVLERASGSMRGMNSDTLKMVRALEDGTLSVEKFQQAMKAQGDSPFKEPVKDSEDLTAAMNDVIEGTRDVKNALVEAFGPSMAAALRIIGQLLKDIAAALALIGNAAKTVGDFFGSMIRDIKANMFDKVGSDQQKRDKAASQEQWDRTHEDMDKMKKNYNYLNSEQSLGNKNDDNNNNNSDKSGADKSGKDTSDWRDQSAQLAKGLDAAGEKLPAAGDDLKEAAKSQKEAAAATKEAAAALKSSGGNKPSPTTTTTTTDGGGSGYAAGGPIRGPGGSREDLAGLFALSNGEFVMQTAAVQKYGIDLFHALNDLSVGGFADGGGVGSTRVSIPTPTTSNAKPSSILNLSIDGNQFRGLVAPNDVARQLKSYAVGRQNASTGVKPSWVQ